MAKVFISYNHQQEQWVLKRLKPCLEAGGAEVLIDRQRFAVGQPVVGQMDATQDQADKHLLILSPEYLNSPYCLHEMKRALRRRKTQPDCIVPVLRHPCSNLPKAFSGWNPLLYTDLCDDLQPDPWATVLQSCNAALGTTAPAWLMARDDLVRYLQRNQSVNLVVQKDVKWRGLIEHIARDYLADLALVNLEDPDTTSRRGLLATISTALGAQSPLPEEPRDLAAFKALLSARSLVARITIICFDLVPHRSYYDVDLFAALRYFIMEMRKMVVLVQSCTPFKALLPYKDLLTDIDILTVELQKQS